MEEIKEQIVNTIEEYRNLSNNMLDALLEVVKSEKVDKESLINITIYISEGTSFNLKFIKKLRSENF